MERILILINERVLKHLKDNNLKEHDEFIKGLYCAKQMVVDLINQDLEEEVMEE